MDVAALSTAGLSQYVALSSNVGASEKAWQSLAQSLANSNLVAAQTAFDTYQKLSQDLASTTSSNSQFSTDMASLGKAIGSGNASAAQQAFATVQSDLKGAPSPPVQNAESAVAQTVGWVDDLLGLSSSDNTTSTATDPATAILDSAYGLNASQTTSDPTLALLESAYGAGATGSSPTSGSDSANSISAGNAGSAASVDVYA